MHSNRGWMGAMAFVFAITPSICFGQDQASQGDIKPVKSEAQQDDRKKAESDASKTKVVIGEQKPKLTEDQRKELAKKLDSKVAEMGALKDKASEVTKSLGALASSGKLPTSDEAIELMKKMVQEMAQIREALSKVQEEVEGIKGWIEGQNEALPIITNDILDLKRNKESSYLQFQYRDTNQNGGANDAFAMRRVRLGSTQTIDPKTSVKWSFDIATGTNTTTAQMRDAYLIYDAEPSLDKVGLQFTGGQQPLPLGYELERSSSEREFPERSQYNQRMFNGERSRGINIKYGIAKNSYVHVGGWDALSFNDPEQANIAPGPQNRLAMSGGIRNFGKHHDVGISHYAGERASFVTGTGATAVTHPRIDREFTYLDATLIGIFLPQLYVRAEWMFGKDRVPVTGTPTSPRLQTDMTGHQIQVGYNLSYNNQINFRYEQFDPNKDVPNNAIIGYGAAFIHYLNPGARITAAHEIFDDASRAGVGQQRYHITTLRVQFKF